MRVLLDIHSGRILGACGVYLVDAAAVLFLGLVLTGLYVVAAAQIGGPGL